VALMDIRMPELDGIEATRRIALAAPETRVMMLTTFGQDEYVWQAMEAGASAFLLKDVPPEELAPAVRTVARGDALLSPAITRRLVEDFVRRPRPGTLPSAVRELTEREREVFVLMARGLSNNEIAEQLYLGETTVKTHVTRVLTKLALRDRVQAVVFAYECGLVTPEGR
jgi:DNA-binding NarL/FixJ family response regulator